MSESDHKIINDVIENFFAADLPDELNRDVQQWLIEEKNLKEKDSAMENEWNSLGSVAADKSVYLSLGKVKASLGIGNKAEGTSRVFLSRRVWLRVAAVVLPLLLIAGGVVYVTSNKQLVETQIALAEEGVEWHEVYVALGEEKKIALPDGSTMHVVAKKAPSKVSYPRNFGEEERMVRMSGETLFNVAKNENMPFVIHTGNLTVEVLGTEFNVEAYDSHEKEMVKVISGRVKVTTKEGDVYVLEPDSKMEYATQ